MRSLPLPPIGAFGVFVVCARCVQDQALASRLLGAAAEVGAAAQHYINLGGLGQLFTFPADDIVGDWVDGSEMEALYTGTLVRQGSDARVYYDALRASSPHGICPYCAQRTVGTLDHYLPKTSRPILAVTPANLVPACDACNKIKLAFDPSVAEEQILHPYFDDFSTTEWLKARVIAVNARPVIEFFADPPLSWSNVVKVRLETHLRVLKLQTLYTSHAAEELVANRELLQRLCRTGGANAVLEHCREQEGTRRTVNINAWQAAYFGALAGSDWFCSTGVMAIDESRPVWPDDPTAEMQTLAAAATS